KTVSLSLTAPITITWLVCNSTSLGSGAVTTCRVTLSGGAPSAGASIALSSDNAALTVPAAVTVAVATTSATFTAKAGTIPANATATVTATYGGSTKTVSLSLTKAMTV